MVHKRLIILVLVVVVLVSSGTIFAQERNPNQSQQNIQLDLHSSNATDIEQRAGNSGNNKQHDKQQTQRDAQQERKQTQLEKQQELQQRQVERQELLNESKIIRKQNVDLIQTQNQLRRDLLEVRKEIDRLQSKPNSLTEEKIRVMRELVSLLKDSRVVVDKTVGNVQKEAQDLMSNRDKLDHASSLRNLESINTIQKQRLEAMNRVQSDIRELLTVMKN